MNSIYVLNRALTLQGIVDEYESLIWRPAYSEVGDFEIYVKATADTLKLLQKDFYVVRSSDISVGESENLLTVTATSQTVNGVTFTVNADGSITANGTATANAVFILASNGSGFTPENGKYILSGCPSGGGYTYDLRFWNYNGSNVSKFDTGNGAEVDFSNSGGSYNVAIVIFSGITANNLTFKPELRKQNVTNYKSVMVIKNIKLTTDIESGAYLTVTGRELKYLLHQRIVWQQTNLSGTAENAIRTLVTQNAISPTDTRRVIPNLVLGESSGLTDSIKKQITGAYLDEAITEICATYNYGWDMYITDGNLTVTVYKGLDRSYAQTERPYVVFSEYFDNLYSTEYELNSEAYANTTLIGGEGEGLDRITTTLGAANSGLDRYEVFTDAKDVSQNKGNTDEIAPADYLLLLEEKGRETLSSLVMTEGFTGEVLSDVTFKWHRDFDLGDIVTVISQYGLSRNVRVMSAIESEDSDGVKLLPVFNL